MERLRDRTLTLRDQKVDSQVKRKNIEQAEKVNSPWTTLLLEARLVVSYRC